MLYKWNHTGFTFRDCFFSFSIIPERFIQNVESINSYFCFISDYYLWYDVLKFNCLPTEEHLGCFNHFAIMDKAAMNINVWVFI